MILRLLAGVLMSAQLVACTTPSPKEAEASGSWHMKDGAPQGDVVSRQLLIGQWHSESTDLHAMKRIEDATRFANGTYVIHFTGVTDAGKLVVDQTECGRWGVSGDIYFTITTAAREGEKSGHPVSPYDATYYDAYRILSLTSAAFEYRSVVAGEVERENRVANGARMADLKGSDAPGSSPCEGAST